MHTFKVKLQGEVCYVLKGKTLPQKKYVPRLSRYADVDLAGLRPDSPIPFGLMIDKLAATEADLTHRWR